MEYVEKIHWSSCSEAVPLVYSDILIKLKSFCICVRIHRQLMEYKHNGMSEMLNFSVCCSISITLQLYQLLQKEVQIVFVLKKYINKKIQQLPQQQILGWKPQADFLIELTLQKYPSGVKIMRNVNKKFQNSFYHFRSCTQTCTAGDTIVMMKAGDNWAE